jgi:hypothetical protein
MGTATNLDEAIGCWTNRPEYRDLNAQGKTVYETIKRCRKIVRANRSPKLLLEELLILQEQNKALAGIIKSAISRCENLVRDGLGSTAPHFIP